MSDKEQISQDDLDEALRRTMSEAEAAVEQMGSNPADIGSGVSSGGGVGDDASDQGAVPDPDALLAKKQTEIDGMRDKWLRAVADLENYKKRSKRDIDDAVQRAMQGLLSNFLPVTDNLERALEAGRERDDDMLKGVRMVASGFYAALARHGIVPVESKGKAFDPALHEALQQIDSPDHAPGTVVTEFEKGFVKGTRLLRPARVIVAGAGSGANLPASVDENADEEASESSEEL
ncbi:MAG: nucleotide exchange factor GrpE [Nannocystaceae bacterium]